MKQQHEVEKRTKEQQSTAQASMSALDQLREWAAGRLVGLLQVDVTTANDTATYLLTMSDNELTKWEETYVGPKVGFAAEFVEMRTKLKLVTLAPKSNRGRSTKAESEKKERMLDQQREQIYRTRSPSPTLSFGSSGTTATATSGSSKGQKYKKHIKVGGITDVQNMEDVLIPVEKDCDCEARRHKLIQNCLNCGKIICEQEGRGPCMFCGLPLSNTAFSQRAIKERLDTEEDEHERERLLEMEKALAQRDRLLMYEATKAKRTIVIDDQSDYFESASNQWLDAAERAEAEEKAAEHQQEREESRKRGGAYTIDLDLQHGLASMQEQPSGLGPAELAALKEQQKKEEAAEYEEFVDQLHISEQYARVRAAVERPVEAVEEEEEDLAAANPRVMAHPKLQRSIPFVATGEAVPKTNTKANAEVAGEKAVARRQDVSSAKVQNDYYEEDDELYRTHRKPKTTTHWVYVNSAIARSYPQGGGEDKGYCLSMHQPWASLLVHGIKKHEGRSWSSTFKGRLWIHAAAHEASQHDIATVENFYRGRGATVFPTYYPTSVLLGSVDVTEVLHTDDYKTKLPLAEQESESEYVFICRSPQLLVVPLRMEGKHKLYQLDKRIWSAAKTQAGMAT
eukprot:NODE_667_length_2204_cov_91.204229_g637_i0.p1 GENE.NODE_667_length_2204_cov_91.204229_g637_i0~~NODE_667_length_2204_cov_91.204229_g637_i0.p1  ORF type:complete len:625 (+),score=154.81 NODE_667_length_2204_cov_91.204229_g637_i0:178-2052(+)